MIASLLVVATLCAPADHPLGRYWSVSTRLAYANAHDEEIDGMGSGFMPELRYEIGEIVTPHLGLHLLVAADRLSTHDWSFVGGGVGLGAAIFPYAGPVALRPSLGIAFLSTSRSAEAARMDDDPGSLFGARAAMGVSIDVLRVGERGVLAVGAEGFALWGSGTTVAGGGLTLSFSRYAPRSPGYP